MPDSAGATMAPPPTAQTAPAAGTAAPITAPAPVAQNGAPPATAPATAGAAPPNGQSGPTSHFPATGQDGGPPAHGAPPHGAAATNGGVPSTHQKARAELPWSPAVWGRIDHAVQTEVRRTQLGPQFLPVVYVPPKTTSVPADTYTYSTSTYGVDEGAVTRLNEYYVEWELTAQQVDQEEEDTQQLGHSTAVTLATKSANVLAQAADLILFQGQNAISGTPLFAGSNVQTLASNKPGDTGLTDFPSGKSAPGAGPTTTAVGVAPITVVQVAPLGGGVGGVIYGPNTFQAVAQAYSALQAVGHYGPYALALETIPYADTFAPLPATLTLTADRIKPLMSGGLFGTGTLPPNAIPPKSPYFGVMVSTGGNTMDLVVGIEPMSVYVQKSSDGRVLLRTLMRFALRIKDPTAIVILQFN